MDVKDRLFIGGEWVAPATEDVIEVISPDTEEVIARVPHASPADIDRAVGAARRALEGPWSRTTPQERVDIMTKVSQGLKDRSQEIAETITKQNGSPISWSLMGQVFSSIFALDYYASLALEYPFEEERPGMIGPTLVRREPVGVVGAIVPWNVPLFVTMLKFAPALASGSTMVLKPAPETPLDAYILAEICQDAGLPNGVFNVVQAGRESGQHLVTHPDVDKIAFTGSSAAGKHIASLCGQQLKRVTLELGGKSAAIILDDADLSQVIPTLVPAATMNNGQACVAQTRILASRDRYGEVAEALVEAMRTLKVGASIDPETAVGPLVAQRQRDRVEAYIASGQEQGAKVALGGGRPEGLDRGWFVEPTVFVNVDNSMRIAQEEIFGPVVSVIPYDDLDHAVTIANDSVYGLSGSIWSTDEGRAIELAKKIRTGSITVNGFSLEFGAPFGGYKCSGLGREMGPEGLDAYVEFKQLNIASGGAATSLSPAS